MHKDQEEALLSFLLKLQRWPLACSLVGGILD